VWKLKDVPKFNVTLYTIVTMRRHTLQPCFSFYIIARKLKKATELTESSLPVHNKTNIDITPVFIYLLCALHVKYQRLTWHIDTVYGELCWLTSLQDHVAFGWKQRLVVCVLSATEWLWWYDMIYLLTAIGLSPGGRSTEHIYTQTIHRTIQNNQYIEQHNNWSVRAVPRLG
jgi:hypothetical protein